MRIIQVLLFVIFLQISNLNSIAQDLYINPSTKLVSVMDTIPLSLTNANSAIDIIQKWKMYLMSPQTTKEIFQIKGEWESIQVGIIFNDNKENNWYVGSGSMYYSNIKTNRLLGTEKANTSNGLVSFKMRYTIDKNGIIYELTNFVYSPNSGGGVGGTANYKGNPFEQESLKINGVYGIIPAITKNKKVWAEIKSDWYKKMEILSSHFQSYVINYYATINQSSPNSFTNSHISYDVYKKIQSGMSYEGVIKLLGDEGKELSNNIIKKENKEVSEQIIVWYVSEDSRDKYIKLTLINKVVTSKSQANL